jgi:hypothetical protein
MSFKVMGASHLRATYTRSVMTITINQPKLGENSADVVKVDLDHNQIIKGS